MATLPSFNHLIQSISAEPVNSYCSYYTYHPNQYTETHHANKMPNPSPELENPSKSMDDVKLDGCCLKLYKIIETRDPTFIRECKVDFQKLNHLLRGNYHHRLIYKSISFLVHKDSNGFNCRVCGKSYKGAHNLRLHITKYHLDLRLYQCPDKNCTYSTAYNDRTRHIAAHHPHLSKKSTQ